MWICATCAVEYDEPLPETCPICADERQWVPEAGQSWLSPAELGAHGQRLEVREVEPGRRTVTAEPRVGIGQVAQVVTTPTGSLLWDPPGYADEATAERIREHGPVLAVAASHPHMFGVQLEWGRMLDAPVLVAEADREWLGRTGPRIRTWSGDLTLADGLELHQVGGHFAGSAVALWAAGAAGRGVLLTGDTVFPNPDRQSLGFLRSYPNKIPLSAAVVERIAARLGGLRFDRIVGNFGNEIATGGADALRASAARHVAWVRGDFDHLT